MRLKHEITITLTLIRHVSNLGVLILHEHIWHCQIPKSHHRLTTLHPHRNLHHYQHSHHRLKGMMLLYQYDLLLHLGDNLSMLRDIGCLHQYYDESLHRHHHLLQHPPILLHLQIHWLILTMINQVSLIWWKLFKTIARNSRQDSQHQPRRGKSIRYKLNISEWCQFSKSNH